MQQDICTNCGYDLSGQPPRRCSECGSSVVVSTTDRLKRRWWGLLVGMLGGVFLAHGVLIQVAEVLWSRHLGKSVGVPWDGWREWTHFLLRWEPNVEALAGLLILLAGIWNKRLPDRAVRVQVVAVGLGSVVLVWSVLSQAWRALQ